MRYYSDDTMIQFVHHKTSVLWKSHDKIIRLIDYSNKNEANELIKKLERVLYEDNE